MPLQGKRSKYDNRMANGRVTIYVYIRKRRGSNVPKCYYCFGDAGPKGGAEPVVSITMKMYTYIIM